MTVFFTADTHFGHGGARALYRRPFANVGEMDEAIARNWNARVTDADEIWHLGDFAVGRSQEQIAALLGRLSGRKHLVTGNNDADATTRQPAWASVQPYAELKFDGRLLVLCHYALRTWRDMGKGALDLHGHSHGRLKPLPRQFDVGVDVRNFSPVTIMDLLAPQKR